MLPQYARRFFFWPFLGVVCYILFCILITCSATGLSDLHAVNMYKKYYKIDATAKNRDRPMIRNPPIFLL